MAGIDTDYLVIGTGGSAMAFVDTLLSESPQASVLMVDRHHRPGGHWNDAYSFVRLHQPSAWYGVASRELSDGSLEVGGFNDGMSSLATGAEVMAHFEQVMKQRFLPSGRVQWWPSCEWLGGEGGVHRVRLLMSGEERMVRVRRKIVNATHARTEVPSTHPPRYRVAAGVDLVPLNRLPAVQRPFACYTVVGSGKTGMDACIWLLENGVPHTRIRWVMPRDAWLYDRANVQTGPRGWERYYKYTTDQFDAIAQAKDMADFFHRLEASGVLLRIDPRVEPTTFRCAVVSRGELEQLRRVGEIVRLGRVQAIEPGWLVMERGELAADPDTLYVDCTSCAIQPAPRVAAFDGDTVNVMMVRTCQPLFSAGLIAWVEAHVQGQAEQNALCLPVPGPEVPLDLLRMWAPTLLNTARWRQNPALWGWVQGNRMNAQSVVLKGVEITPQVMAVLKSVGEKAAAAGARLPQLLATATA